MPTSRVQPWKLAAKCVNLELFWASLLPGTVECANLGYGYKTVVVERE